MTVCSIFTSIEFYVIATVVAAAVIAASAMPSRRGPVRTFLFAGRLLPDSGPDWYRMDVEADTPAVQFTVTDEGLLKVQRYGLEGISADSAFSLAVEIAGLDVVINERLTPSRRPGVYAPAPCGPDDIMPEAEAVLDCFGRERYHFRYYSEATGRSCAFYLNIAPGNTIARNLCI